MQESGTMEKTINDWLINHGWGDFADVASFPLSIITVILIAWISYIFMRRIIFPIIMMIVEKSPTKWDDDIFSPAMVKAVCQLLPALIVAWLLPKVFMVNEKAFIWITKLTQFYIVWACVHVVNRLIDALFHTIDKRDGGRIHSLKGTFQMFKLIIIGIGIIIGAGILFDKSPISILTAFGASAAVLMLVFKDTILGLVAGVQLTANKMLRKGDWIICNKAGANGEVIDISLTTVKVRNWDNSIITVPPYNLISDSFQNYQPMRTSGGRRVSRFIYIDINSVRFLETNEVESLREKNLLSEEECLESSRIVNLGLFRRHMKSWLENHKDVVGKKGRTMFTMVRQLQSTPQGIPLELYFFTSKTDWALYEEVQSDIFDYVYAIVGEFGLKIYQAPAGSDFSALQKPDNYSIHPLP